MDRALWLLMWLKLRGWARRMTRNLGTVRGAIVTVLVVLMMASWLAGMVVNAVLHPGSEDRASPEQVERFGALGLLAYCLLMATSSAEHALAFTPAEVGFLFSGPFSRRQLLTYKLVAYFLLALPLALFMALNAWIAASSLLSAFVGVFLTLTFLQLFVVVVALLGSTAGALASNRSRQWLVAGILLAIVAPALLVLTRPADGSGALAQLQQLEQSPVLQAVLTPLRWFPRCLTVTHVWPDLAEWGGRCLLLDLLLLGLVYALDARYLETSAAASERLYARLERMRRGGALAAMGPIGRGRPRFRPPGPPWWGGAGPVAWRQAVTALRSLSRVTLFLVALAVWLGIPILLGLSEEKGREALPYLMAGAVAMATFLLGQVAAFDFRADLDRMETLKSLPVRPVPLVLGQLVVPVVFVSGIQAVGLVVIEATVGGLGPVLPVGLALVLPFNVLMFGLENLAFLLYPNRRTAAQADFSQIGRQALVASVKLMVLGATGTAAGAVGAGVYFLTGRSWPPAVAAAWVVLAATGGGLLPLIALAFNRFDVARDVP